MSVLTFLFEAGNKINFSLTRTDWICPIFLSHSMTKDPSLSQEIAPPNSIDNILLILVYENQNYP